MLPGCFYTHWRYTQFIGLSFCLGSQMNRSLKTAIITTAVTALCLLSLAGICFVAVGILGASVESSTPEQDNVAQAMIYSFICCGLCLPGLPLAVGAGSYFLARINNQVVEENLATLPDQADET